MGTVIVRGYADLFADARPVSVVWDGFEQGPVCKAQVVRFDIEHNGRVLFKVGSRRTNVAVLAGRTNDIQLEYNGIFGLKATELVTDVERFQQAVAENRAHFSSENNKPLQPVRLNCPHCGGQQTVSRESVKLKKGYSVGKIATGFFSMGQSLLFTGVSRKGWANQLTCSACGMVWHVE